MFSQGPNSGSSFSNDSSAGTVDWVNPGNAIASDDIYATATLVVQPSHYLLATGFGFSIPLSAVITGVLVEVEDSSNVASDAQTGAALAKAGALTGTAKIGSNPLPTSDAYESYGGSGDLWGATLTPSDVNDFGFGVLVRAFLAGAAAVISIDHIRVTVYYEVVSFPQSQAGNRKFKAGGMKQVDFLS